MLRQFPGTMVKIFDKLLRSTVDRRFVGRKLIKLVETYEASGGRPLPDWFAARMAAQAPRCLQCCALSQLRGLLVGLGRQGVVEDPPPTLMPLKVVPTFYISVAQGGELRRMYRAKKALLAERAAKKAKREKRKASVKPTGDGSSATPCAASKTLGAPIGIVTAAVAVPDASVTNVLPGISGVRR